MGGAAHGGTRPAGARRHGARVLLLAAALCTLAGCGGPRGLYWPIIPPDLPAPRLVDERANGSSVDLVRTQWLLVRLPLQGSDDRWSFDLDRSRNLYPSGNTPRVETDASGTRNQIFTFRAEAAGTSTLRFDYRTGEAGAQPPARSVSFDVVAH